MIDGHKWQDAAYDLLSPCLCSHSNFSDGRIACVVNICEHLPLVIEGLHAMKFLLSYLITLLC